MNPPTFPSRKSQRTDLKDELVRRGRVWLPEWRPDGPGSDLAAAIFEIAARLESQVTQRLARIPEKTFRGFLYWLGVRGAPGHAARLPIAMKLAAGSVPVLADAPVQIQADANGTPVIFETAEPMLLTPANLVTVIGATLPDSFAAGPVSTYDAPSGGPNAWRVATDVSAGATDLQLDPPVGLAVGITLVDGNELRYRVTAAQGGLVTIDPGLVLDNLGANPVLRLAQNFDPFGADRDQQTHALYIGSTTALDITFPAAIDVVGAQEIVNCDWSYWGSQENSTEVDWQTLKVEVQSDKLTLRACTDEPKALGGKFETSQIGTKKSRWLRATVKKTSNSLNASKLSLSINCASITCPGSKDTTPSAPTKLEIEGIANTAPLVLDQPFYPLGPEPRLFDAFYLGCDEAFSKANADVTVHFTIGGEFSGPLAALSMSNAALVTAVRDDGKLNLIEVPQSPNDPVFFPPVQFIDAEGRVVMLNLGLRPGVAVVGDARYITASAGAGVWMYAYPDSNNEPKWSPRYLGSPDPAGPTAGDTVILRTGAGSEVLVYAVAGGKLYRRTVPSNGVWELVKVTDGSDQAKVARITPIIRAEAEPGKIDVADGLAVVDASGQIFSRIGNMSGFRHRADSPGLDPAVYPLVVSRPQPGSGAGRQTLVFAASSQKGELLAFDLNTPTNLKTISQMLVGGAFGCVSLESGVVGAAFVTKNGDNRSLALWQPFDGDTLVFDWPDPNLAGAPVPRAGKYLTPLMKGVVATGAIDAGAVARIDDPKLGFAAIIQNGAPWIGGTRLLVAATRLGEVFDVDAVSRLNDRAVAMPLRDGRDSNVMEPVNIYRGRHDYQPGIVLARDQVELIAGDTAAVGDLLYLSWGTPDKRRFITIVALTTNPLTNNPVAVLSSQLPAGLTNVTYGNVDAVGSDTALLRPVVTAPGIPAALLSNPRTHLEIGDNRQRVLYAIPPDQLVLADRWQGNQKPASLLAVAAFPDWKIFQPPRPTNPRLSWEYWNGLSWWSIPDVGDETANLVTTGDVTFCVPPELQQTDVVGRKQYWIRARLVGGDYGQEEVRIEGVAPKQTVVRDTSKIRAPYVTGLTVGYEVCCPVAPEYVLTEDNGGILDQTAASQAPNAVVKVFTPLWEALKAPASAPNGGATATTNGCSCGSTQVAPTTAKPTATVDDCNSIGDPPAAATWSTDSGPARAIFLGFDQSMQGTGISLLFLLEDKAFEGAFPLTVEGYANGVFSPVSADDGTRGLGETGVLTLSLPEDLQQAVFFGRAQYWLRLSPNSRMADPASWRPQIRAVYVNGAWATACETQTKELLGSSDGSPNQSFILARPPVVENSLKLRVREPLGDEDIKALKAKDPDSVLDSLGPWEGPWVLWTLKDTDTGAPQDRIYDFDPATGTVGFGNGERAKIPPVGRDNIAAERYQAGGGAAANHVTAWSQLNLITPVQGVERTIAPEGAVGGADPQDASAVLRFAPAQLAMRGRAVTLRDFEQLAFQSSSDVAQVRAIASGRSVRVIAVMRGMNPCPSIAELRAIKNALLECASPALAVSGVLLVQAPDLVEVTVRVTATVPDLSLGADVAREVITRIKALLDPASGGFDGTGWRLGDMLFDTEVAAALDGTPNLEDFAVDISLAADAAAPLKVNQLLVLSNNGVRVACQSSAAEAVG